MKIDTKEPLDDCAERLLAQLPAVPEAVQRRLKEDGVGSLVDWNQDCTRPTGLFIKSDFDRLDEIKEILAEFGISRRRWPEPKYEWSLPYRIHIRFNYSPAGWTAARYRLHTP